jgi:hypothetical protein
VAPVSVQLVPPKEKRMISILSLFLTKAKRYGRPKDRYHGCTTIDPIKK